MINVYTEFEKALHTISTNSDVTDGNKIVTGFSTGIVPTPLKCLYTVIRPLNLDITKVTTASGTQINEAKFTVGITLHKAEKLDPTELLEKFSLMIALFEESEELSLYSSGFEEMERNADTNSIFLPGRATFIYYF